jgi:glutamate synthase (NADPH/NADH) small chain
VLSCSEFNSLRMVASNSSLNCTVGEDITFDAIRGQHDAVLIATGVYKSRDIEAPGVGAPVS